MKAVPYFLYVFHTSELSFSSAIWHKCFPQLKGLIFTHLSAYCEYRYLDRSTILLTLGRVLTQRLYNVLKVTFCILFYLSFKFRYNLNTQQLLMQQICLCQLNNICRLTVNIPLLLWILYTKENTVTICNKTYKHHFEVSCK